MIRRVILIMVSLLLIGSFLGHCYADDASQLVAQGRAALFNNGNFTYSGIISANSYFEQAVQSEPDNQEANFFYAVTRMAVFALQEGSGSGLETLCDLFEAFGMTRSSNDSVEDSAYNEYPELLNHPYAPDTIPGGEEVRTFLSGPFVDLIDDALSNLSVITDTFTTTITSAETGDTDVEVDYGDVLAFRSLLYSLKGILLFVSAYDVDIDLRDVIVKGIAHGLEFQRDLLDKYSNLLSLRSDGTTALSNAKAAFINAIDAYNDAYNFIVGEQDPQDDDLIFFADDQERQDAQDFGSTLNDIKTSLQNNTFVDLNDDPNEEFFVDFNYVFGNTGKSPLDIRAILPQFDKDAVIIAGTWPSPILNNIFPDISTEQGLVNAFQPQMVYDIPVASITLDGQDNEWSNIDPIITDDEDASWINGGDIDSIKVAKDSDHLYWMMTLHNPPTVNNVLYNTDFALGEYFDEWDYMQYDSQAYKDSGGNHYWLHSHYRGQIQTFSEDPNAVGMGTVVEAGIPLNLFEGHVVKARVRSWTDLGGARDTVEVEPFIRFPSSSISGTITCPDYDGEGHIFVFVYDGPEPTHSNLLGTAVLDVPGSYTISGLPIGAEVYVWAGWDADNNGVLTEGDYLSGTSGVGPYTVEASGTTINDPLEVDSSVEVQPIWASVQRIINSDGSISTEFKLQSVQPYDAITVLDPEGRPILRRSDFQLDFFPGPSLYYYAIVPGSPALGQYTFLAIKGLTLYKGTDLQYINRDIPVADKTQFSPADGSVVTSKTPTFSWHLVDFPDKHLFYRLYIKDQWGNYIYASQRVLDMTSITIPQGVLYPGGSFSYKVSVFDDSDYAKSQNRSNSDWIYFTTASSLTHPAKPVVDTQGGWGALTWTSPSGSGVLCYAVVLDYDGVACDGTSHTVMVTPPGGSAQPMNFDVSYGPYEAGYWYWVYPPASGDYVFTVSDPDGNTTSYTYPLDASTPLSVINENSISPSIINESITARFDNVYVNGSLYDDFESYTDINDLDSTKWSNPYTEEGGAASIVTEGSDKKLELSAGGTVGDSEATLCFTNPESINSVRVDVKIIGASSDNVPRARIVGHWFNDGAGDIWADISVWNNRITYGVLRYPGPDKTPRYDLLVPNTKIRDVSPGENVTISITYDRDTATITFDAGNGASAQYVNQTGVALVPLNNFKRIQVRNKLFVSTTPTFSWDPVSGASRYRVKIYDGYDIRETNVIWKGYTGSTSYQVPPGILQPNAVYRFRLDAFYPHRELDLEDASRTNIYMFFTDSTQTQDPYIEFDGVGVQTWQGDLVNPHLDFWIKVWDAQGVPGNIKSVKVTTPDNQDLYLEYDNTAYTGFSTCGVYRGNLFVPPVAGTYTFTVTDRDGHTYTTTEELTVDSIGYPDPTSITPADNTTVNDSSITFSWGPVQDAAFYSLRIYDESYRRVYRFATDNNQFTLQPGFLQHGRIYRYRILTRREFFDQNVDNGSTVPWLHTDYKTIINSPTTGGTAAPTIDLKNMGAIVLSYPDPGTDNTFYWLVLQAYVEDGDGVPANIASVHVTFPDNTTTRELHFDQVFSTGGCNYIAVIPYDDLNDIQSGNYAFEVQDRDGNSAQATDDLVINEISPVNNMWPAEGDQVTSTTPVIDWNDISGASSYEVKVFDAWLHTTLVSPCTTSSSYAVPAGTLEADRVYGYRVYAFREDPTTSDVDNASVSSFTFASRAHFEVVTGITDSDGDGLSDMYENSNGTNPFDADSDDDGIRDDLEINTYGTNPTELDTDGDGIQDGTELGFTWAQATPATEASVFQPDPDPEITTDPLNSDTDGDGMPDGWEEANNLNPTVNDALADADGDGFSNLREYVSGTDPSDISDIPALLGDYEPDGDVDGIDLSQFSGYFKSELGRTDCAESSPCLSDLDGDGDVDVVDLIFFSEDFGRVE